MPRKSFDDWFDRELAELKAGLEKLEASLDPRLSQPVENRAATPRPVVSPKRAEVRGRKPAKPSAAPRKPAVANDTSAPSAAAPEPAQAAASKAPAPAPASSTQQAQPVPPPTPPRPSGSDLSDPKNFGLEPPTAELERGASQTEDYRQRLTRHIAFSTRVLHTSGVPAAVWREWRMFERAAQERLRELNARPPDPDLE